MGTDSSMTSRQTVIPLLLLTYLTSTLVSGMSPGVRCSCGVEGNARIVSGQNVPRGKYPWVAIVTQKNSTKIGGCGATLISSRWAITAAHCVNPTRPITSIVLGEHDITGVDSLDINRLDVGVSAMIPHPDYNNPLSMSHDIALLLLSESVDLTVHTPACLPSPGRDYTGYTGVVYGWGRTDPCAPGLSAILQEVSVEIVSDNVCDTASGNYTSLSGGECLNFSGDYAGNISEDMLCAGAPGRDSCQGDSGGPTAVKEDGHHPLVWVVSWGLGCAADGLYGVYSEVANPKIRAWIDSTVAENGGATYCTS